MSKNQTALSKFVDFLKSAGAVPTRSDYWDSIKVGSVDCEFGYVVVDFAEQAIQVRARTAGFPGVRVDTPKQLMPTLRKLRLI